MTWRAITVRPCIAVFPDGELNIQAERTKVEPFTRSAMRTAPLNRRAGGADRGHSAGYGGERVRDAHVDGGGGEMERESGEWTRRPDSDSGRFGSGGGGLGQGRLVDALSSLSAEAVDTLEDIIRRGRLESAGRRAEPRAGGGGGNGGGGGGGVEPGDSRSGVASAGVSRPLAGIE
jgi:hypothetical protein